MVGWCSKIVQVLLMTENNWFSCNIANDKIYYKQKAENTTLRFLFIHFLKILIIPLVIVPVLGCIHPQITHQTGEQ